MIKKILNRYFVSKYGNVYAPKPPLGFSKYDHPSFYQLVRYRLLKKVWWFDCIIDRFAGGERKVLWLKPHNKRIKIMTDEKKDKTDFGHYQKTASPKEKEEEEELYTQLREYVDDNCVVCGTKDMLFQWSDYSGEGMCTKCGCPYQLKWGSDEQQKEGRYPYLNLKKEFVPVAKEYWNENHKFVCYGQMLGTTPTPGMSMLTAWLEKNYPEHIKS